jgi:hypothetical protein
VGVGGRRKKQRRRLPFLKIGGSFLGHIIFDRGYPLPRNLIPIKMRSCRLSLIFLSKCI